MTSLTSSHKRLLLDSNVWISALVFGGKPRQIIATAINEGHSLLASEHIYTEVRRILVTKFPDFVQDFEDLIMRLKERITVVQLGSITITVCRDPDDNKVLETAVLGGASVIISGDKDLLVLKVHDGITILSPDMFLLTNG